MHLSLIGLFIVGVISASAQAGELPDYEVLDMQQPKKHAVLRKVAAALTFPLNDEDRRDVKIVETKFDGEENMAGLAAPQIGISKKIIVFATPEDPALKKWRPDFTQSMPKTIWINPSYEPVEAQTHQDYEACFSVNDMAGPVKRFKTIKYRAYDLDGNLVEGQAEGFLARVIQHEVDHVNGMLFVDYVPDGELMLISEYRDKKRKAMKDDL